MIIKENITDGDEAEDEDLPAAVMEPQWATGSKPMKEHRAAVDHHTSIRESEKSSIANSGKDDSNLLENQPPPCESASRMRGRDGRQRFHTIEADSSSVLNPQIPDNQKPVKFAEHCTLKPLKARDPWNYSDDQVAEVAAAAAAEDGAESIAARAAMIIAMAPADRTAALGRMSAADRAATLRLSNSRNKLWGSDSLLRVSDATSQILHEMETVQHQQKLDLHDQREQQRKIVQARLNNRAASPTSVVQIPVQEAVNEAPPERRRRRRRTPRTPETAVQLVHRKASCSACSITGD